jgi:predicted XRE-type DNA-binding protein
VITCTLAFELPAEILAQLGSPEEVAAKAREALLLELLRHATLGQSRVAELLGITRSDLLDLMARHQIASGLVTPQDLDEEVATARALAKADRTA